MRDEQDGERAEDEDLHRGMDRHESVQPAQPEAAYALGHAQPDDHGRAVRRREAQGAGAAAGVAVDALDDEGSGVAGGSGGGGLAAGGGLGVGRREGGGMLTGGGGREMNGSRKEVM